MNRAFGPETRYVSTIGLSQIAGAQFLHSYKPRHWINAGQAGPLGWTLPGRARRRAADPDATVVALSGDYDFQFMIEELAVGAQFKLPYIHVVVNNAYLGLIRQSQRGFDMDYCVQLSFDNVNAPEVERLRSRSRQGGRRSRVQGDPRRRGGRDRRRTRAGQEVDRRVPGARRRRGHPGARDQRRDGDRARQRHRVRGSRADARATPPPPSPCWTERARAARPGQVQGLLERPRGRRGFGEGD